ncbi:MAG: hypothetical protein KF795_00320 [Labilithrix sp.]|nr:hypothetical protein [Labilithrix sp.]
MAHQISGNPGSFPVSFSIPDDGDARTAASVNVAFEALADRTALLQARVGKMEMVEFTSSGSWPVPDGVDTIFAELIGGGGGGGAGGNSGGGGGTGHSGGGGGGAAQLVHLLSSVEAGTLLQIAVGTGGAGAPTNASAQMNLHGGDGGASSITWMDTLMQIHRRVALGGQGGTGGWRAGLPEVWVSPGGGTVARGTNRGRSGYFTNSAQGGVVPVPCVAPGEGGWSTTHAASPAQHGSPSVENHYDAGPSNLGLAGSVGADVGANLGGEGGGGGGSSAFGRGGHGGSGGNGNTSGAGVAGQPGQAPPADAYGAGGGGGGGGGVGSSTNGAGGAGAAGRQGLVRIFYLVTAAAP